MQKSGYVISITAQIMSHKFYSSDVSIFFKHDPATAQKNYIPLLITTQNFPSLPSHCQVTKFPITAELLSEVCGVNLE
jgi:hypothetical protein